MSEENATSPLALNSAQLAQALFQTTVSKNVYDLCTEIERLNSVGIPVALRESLARLLYSTNFEPHNAMRSDHQFICQFALLDCAERHTGQLSPEDPQASAMKAEVKVFNERIKAIVQRFDARFPYSQTLSQLNNRLEMRIQHFSH